MKFNGHKVKLRYIVILLAAAFLLGNRGFRGLVKNSLEYRRLQERKDELVLEKAALEDDLRSARSPGSVERAARKKLGLLRPEEIEYRFDPPGKKND